MTLKNKIASLVATCARPQSPEERDRMEARLKTIIPQLVKLDNKLQNMDPFEPDFSKRFSKTKARFKLLADEYKFILNRDFCPEKY